MEKIWVEKTASTNSLVKEKAGELPPMTLILAREQTAGRGQRGNSWESESGKNLTFSFWFDPNSDLGSSKSVTASIQMSADGVNSQTLTPLKPAEQFAISEAVALAFVGLLARYGIEASVKWPNDIYTGNKKICGILIENSIMGDRISRSIVGAGLNVNQKEFRSDAPIPVSMTQITGKEYNLEEIADSLGEQFRHYLGRIGSKELHEEYLRHMWRNDGREHPFRDMVSGEEFMARIEDVEPSGHLLLSNGRRYAFKEVAFLI